LSIFETGFHELFTEGQLRTLILLISGS
jgi:hypothetical protein